MHPMLLLMSKVVCSIKQLCIVALFNLLLGGCLISIAEHMGLHVHT